MSKKLLLGASIFTAASALAGAGLMQKGYSEELKRDDELAVTAQDYLDHQPEITEQIMTLAAKKQAEIAHIGTVIGADCFNVVINKSPQAIEDITAQADCRLDDSSIKRVRKLYNTLDQQKNNLKSYLEPNQYYTDQEPTLSVAEHDAKSMIADAKVADPWGDLFDSAEARRLIAVKVEGDEVIDTSRYSNHYNEIPLFFWGILTFGGLVTVISSAVELSKQRRQDQETSLYLT